MEVAHKQSQQKRDQDRHSSVRQFAAGDLVMAKNFCTGPKWVPATVVARLGPLSYLLEMTEKQLWRRHVNHVKARVGVNSPTSSQTRPVETWDHVTCSPSSSGVSSGGMPEVSADREVDRQENEATASAAGSDTTQGTIGATQVGSTILLTIILSCY